MGQLGMYHRDPYRSSFPALGSDFRAVLGSSCWRIDREQGVFSGTPIRGGFVNRISTGNILEICCLWLFLLSVYSRIYSIIEFRSVRI